MIESGWLIEFKSSVYRTLHYWGRTNEGLGATPECMDAIRFARQRDAEDVIADNGWTECQAAEHIWDDGLRADMSHLRSKE